MARRSRLFAPLNTLVTIFTAAITMATVWGAQAPPGTAGAAVSAAVQTAPAAPQAAPAAPAVQSAPALPGAPAMAPAGGPRVKPSDPPHLVLFFTDQVIGYIQPCG